MSLAQVLERRLGRAADRLSGGLILFLVVWGPWSFGTTTPWAIQVMNACGFALGGLYLLKRMLRHRLGVRVPAGRSRTGHLLDTALNFFGRALLAFCFLSAWNARAPYHPETWSFHYRDAIQWLPHSYDAESTWRAFWMYLGLAGVFWGVRDWLRWDWRREGPQPVARREESPQLPDRLRLLLWVLSLNGALVAVEGIIQRAAGAGQLLWLLEPRVNKEPVSFFGPFAYRSNAAQYFNLLWPVTLGLWWTCQRAGRHPRPDGSPGRQHHVLLSCVLLLTVAPLVATSRGGVVVTAGLVVFALFIFLFRRWRGQAGSRFAIVAILGVAVGCSLLLGWDELAPRLEGIQQGLAGREAIYLTGRAMAEDAPVHGTGPGTFTVLFQLYRRSVVEYWPAQLHNDWLETRITFGLTGLGLILLCLVLAAGRWLARGGAPADGTFLLLTLGALGGCLVHARYDFPFQIPSILALFLILCASLSCLSRPSSRDPA